MGVKTPICVYSSDEGKSQPLDTISTHFDKTWSGTRCFFLSQAPPPAWRGRSLTLEVIRCTMSAECALISSTLLLLPVTLIFFNLFYQMWESQWTIGCLLGRKLIGWFPPPPPYYMCLRGRSPKPKPWIYSSLAGGDSHQHLKFSYLLFLYLRCEQELFTSPPENVSGIFGH